MSIIKEPTHRSGINPLALVGSFIAIITAVWIGIDDIPTGTPDLTTLAQKLAGFLIIALAIERATEVVIQHKYGAHKISLKAASTLLMQPILAAQERAITATGTPQATAARKAAEEAETILATDGAMHHNMDAQNALSAQCQRTALTTGMILGTALALAGMRFLETVFGTNALDVTSPTKGWDNEIEAFRSFVDITLSAALLAGGSDGIHKIIKRATQLLPSK